MKFLVQFKRYRRGVLEVIQTLPIAAINGTAALAFARSPTGMRHWPTRTDALRVMDEGGRTLLDWAVPAVIAQPATNSPLPVPRKPADKEARPAPLMTAAQPEEGPTTRPSGRHRFAVGQAVSYAGDGQPEIWKGGYEIVRLDDPHREPQYAIRSADQSYDRIVYEHELREDLGARARGR